MVMMNGGKDFRKVIKDSFIKLMDISEALD